MKIGAIILSRMDSSRLPGKALEVVNGRPLIDYVVMCCRQIEGVDVVAIATSDRPQDDALEEFSKDAGIACIRGSLNDVSGRFLSSMQQLELDGALRFNGDSPLNDVALLSEGVRIFRSGKFDLVSNVPQRTYPYGMSLEVVSRNAMEKVCLNMEAEDHKEHVTKYFYDNIDLIKAHLVTLKHSGYSGIQLAVDSPIDLERFSWIINHLDCDPVDAGIKTLVDLALQSPMGAYSKKG